MLVTLDIKETVIDEFMKVLKQFSDDDVVIENQSFINEKERIHQALKSIDDGAAMINDNDFWEGTEQAINSQQ